jgi:hypothetical protein
MIKGFEIPRVEEISAIRLTAPISLIMDLVVEKINGFIVDNLCRNNSLSARTLTSECFADQ